MTTCECGLSYVPGVPEDDEAHAKIHNEYLYGAKLREIERAEAVGTVAGYPLVVVDATLPHDVRCRLAEAAYVAQRSTPSFPAGYDGTITDASEKLFLVTDDLRGIAIALTGLDDHFWSLAWKTDGTVELVDNVNHAQQRQKVGRVWVAKAYRRHDIGTDLVRAVADYLEYELADLGWELPLTPDGAYLLRCLVPRQWWGRGDSFVLRKTLGDDE